MRQLTRELPSRRKFSDKQYDELVERWNHGEEMDDIAVAMGITRQQVQYYLRQVSKQQTGEVDGC